MDTVDHGGIRVIGHAQVPPGSMYAMAHSRGPFFVSGPTTLTCTGEEIVVRRHCWVEHLTEAMPGEAPFGEVADVRFR